MASLKRSSTSLKMSWILSAHCPLTNCSWRGSCCFAPRSISRKVDDRILPLVVLNNHVDQFLANQPGCKTGMSTLGPIFQAKVGVCVFHLRLRLPRQAGAECAAQTALWAQVHLDHVGCPLAMPSHIVQPHLPSNSQSFGWFGSSVT